MARERNPDSMEGQTSAINQLFIFTLLGAGAQGFGLVSAGFGLVFHTDSLEITFCFQSSEFIRLLLVEVNMPLRLEPFTCIFTHPLQRFRHLSLMLCLQPILCLKLDLRCSLLNLI